MSVVLCMARTNPHVNKNCRPHNLQAAFVQVVGDEAEETCGNCKGKKLSLALLAQVT
jgi:hypothetical protein